MLTRVSGFEALDIVYVSLSCQVVCRSLLLVRGVPWGGPLLQVYSQGLSTRYLFLYTATGYPQFYVPNLLNGQMKGPIDQGFSRLLRTACEPVKFKRAARWSCDPNEWVVTIH